MLVLLFSCAFFVLWREEGESLKEVLLRVSALATDFSETVEVEINPLIVFDKGRGCDVVAARIFLKDGPV